MRKPRLSWSEVNENLHVARCGALLLNVTKVVDGGEYDGMWQWAKDSFHADLDGAKIAIERKLWREAQEMLEALRGR